MPKVVGHAKLTHDQHRGVLALVAEHEWKCSNLATIKKALEEHLPDKLEMTPEEIHDLAQYSLHRGSRSRYGVLQSNKPGFHVTGQKRQNCRLLKGSGKHQGSGRNAFGT